MACEKKDNFDQIEISTETIIGKTNCKINIAELFNHLPYVEYKVIPKKRGRRPKDEKKVEPQLLNDGDIITLKYGDNVRGVDLKSNKKKSGDNYFRNSVTIVMSCDNKKINFKISKNGKFQFTGCKNEEHSHRCLRYIFDYIQQIQTAQNKKILSVPPNTNIEVVYLTVMANINFSLGFCVNKENLDSYFTKHTEYTSLLETSFGYTGVNIKMNLPNMNNVPITKMAYDRENKIWKKEQISYKDYIEMLDDKEKTKEKNKVRYNTFLVFQSGNVILSSSHKECMRDSYHTFLNIIQRCRPEIEEKIE